MATLTETARAARKAVKIGGLALAAFLIFKMILGIVDTYFRVVKPAPAPPPTVAFGKLPAIDFPEKLHPELTLRLETPTGGTPDLGDRAEVYLMPTFRSSFLALEGASKTAKKLGFEATAKEITSRRYRWESEEFLPSILEMDIVNGSFLLKRNWQADPTILTDKQLPGQEQAAAEAKNFLRQSELMTEELNRARTAVVYLTFKDGQYQEAVSLSEADFVEVNLYRPAISELPVLPQEPEKGIVRIIFSGSNEAAKRVVQTEFNYYPVNLDQMATYPIKNASQAWRELQTRQGYIASIGQNTGGVVAIRRIYLGYYDAEVPGGFLMPIIVFEGDNGFYGYVQAVTNDWLQAPAIDGLKTPS